MAVEQLERTERQEKDHLNSASNISRLELYGPLPVVERQNTSAVSLNLATLQITDRALTHTNNQNGAPFDASNVSLSNRVLLKNHGRDGKISATTLDGSASADWKNNGKDGDVKVNTLQGHGDVAWQTEHKGRECRGGLANSAQR
jgi:hypothetical protein